MKNYNKLKKVIQEANPDLDVSYMGDEFEMKIKLADVLMAIGEVFNNKKSGSIIDNLDGVAYHYYCQKNVLEIDFTWNDGNNGYSKKIIGIDFSKDLDNQTNEVKEFLIELLVTDK